MNIPESNVRNMLKKISEGNHVLNEMAKFAQVIKTDCPDCGFDPIRGESTNINCETCGGLGSIETIIETEVSISVETEQDYRFDFTKAGTLTTGQILATIDIQEINEDLNLNPVYDMNNYAEMHKFVQKYEYFTWKGAKYTVESFEPGWLQGNLYEISVIANLRD